MRYCLYIMRSALIHLVVIKNLNIYFYINDNLLLRLPDCFLIFEEYLTTCVQLFPKLPNANGPRSSYTLLVLKKLFGKRNLI